jgi:hypothetical protein
MNDRNRKENNIPKVIVEYVPGKRGAGEGGHEAGNKASHRHSYYRTNIKPISPFRLAILGATGLVVLCLLLAASSVLLLLAVGTGLLYMVWRRLTGRRR